MSKKIEKDHDPSTFFLNKCFRSLFLAAIFTLAAPMAALNAQDASGVSEIQSASFFDFMKGCLLVGGVGGGATMIGVSTSGVALKDSKALVVGGVASCLVGGFIVGDVYKKANIEAAMELRVKNQQLRNSVYSVMHDLCVMKKECGADGLPMREEEKSVNFQISGQSPGPLEDKDEWWRKKGYVKVRSGN